MCFYQSNIYIEWYFFIFLFAGYSFALLHYSVLLTSDFLARYFVVNLGGEEGKGICGQRGLKGRRGVGW